ncbi:MAG: hypothetical protein IJ642_12195 [Oscillospiraceae bacterium]|nr:hypothetical protein [Oscillospiraceae bacterium]
MFTNRENCTVWEKTVVSRAPAYIRHEIGRNYQETTDAQEIGGRNLSRSPASQQLFVIPAESMNYLPKKDDRIKDGICTESSPPTDALTVVSVKDFRFGSDYVQHIEVTAE